MEIANDVKSQFLEKLKNLFNEFDASIDLSKSGYGYFENFSMKISIQQKNTDDIVIDLGSHY